MQRMEFTTYEVSLGWRLSKSFIAYLKASFVDYASQSNDMQYGIDRLSVLVLHEAIEQEEILEEGMVFFRRSQAYALQCMYRYAKISQINDRETNPNFLLFEQMFDDTLSTLESAHYPATTEDY